MFAVVKIAGKQYKVKEQDIIDVDHIAGNEGDSITLSDVLLTATDTHVTVGEPLIHNSKVSATIVSQFKGEKVEVRRYKSKVRYRKANGFRATLTKLKITSIA